MDSDRSIDGGATLREAGGSTPYQITANYYYNRPSRSIPDYRYDLLDSQLSSIARSGGVRHVGVEEAWELLARVPADPSKTGGILVYSVVFEPNKMMMHVAVSENGEQAPLCHKISFDINALLAGVR
jgi:hypothetical protein